MSSRLITENDLKAILESMPSKNIAGEIKTYAGIVVPDGWLECDGSEVLIEDYPLLAAALGADHPDPDDPDYVEPIWGVPTDADHFLLPNLTGKVPVGHNPNDTIFDTVGKTGGTKDAIVPYHLHSIPAQTITGGAHTHPVYYSTFEESGSGTVHQQLKSSGSSYNTGSTSHSHSLAAHNTNYAGISDNEVNANLQPYAVVKYIICAA